MAADFDAILTTVRGVLVDNDGSIRTVGANRFRGEYFEALGDTAQASVTVKPRVEARLVSCAPHPSRPLRMGSWTIYDIELEVLVVRDISGAEELIDSRRDDVRALAGNDADIIAQALEWAGASGNLNATSGGTSTGLVSGVLTYVGSDFGDVELGAGGARIETAHKFRGVVRATTPAHDAFDSAFGPGFF